MSDVVHVTACRLCDSDLDLVVSFRPTPIGDHYVTADKWSEEQPCYPLDVMLCKACGAVQLADTVDPKLIYPDTYLYTTSVSKGLDLHFARYSREVMTRALPKGDDALAVDIGSNDGTLLRHFACYGLRVVGVEPSFQIATKAQVAGISTYNAFFTVAQAAAIRSVEGQAGIITANHVMANVADLHDFTKGVKHLLAPAGTFVFETGYWPAIVENYLIDTIEHEHIHYFAAKPLQQFFSSHGLTLVHVETNSAKGGSLRGYVQHTGVEPDGTVAEMIGAEERGLSVGHLSFWVSQLKQLEQEMKAQIAQAEGETWVGYGAAVGSTLLLHQFSLGEKLLCLVDGNPQKHNRLSPGYHLRVVDPIELIAIKPDKIVILAWRYAEMIQRQHPEFAGKFILPLPEVVTV